jgi:hypothetical protein
MAWRIQNIDHDAAKFDPVTFGDNLINIGNLRGLSRRDNAATKLRLQARNALDMVGMLVGHENIRELPAGFSERIQNRRLLWRINRRGRSRLRIMHQHREIVAAAQKLSYFNHLVRHPMRAARRCSIVKPKNSE